MDRPSSHSQRGPYARKEGRKSLLSKVKDSVKDMLSPSWLSDLVSNVKKDPPSDSAEIGQQQMYMSPVGTPQGIPQSGMPQPMPQSSPMPFQAQGMPLGNGQPRMMEFANRGPSGLVQGEQMSPFQQPMIPPPVSEFTSSQLPLARLTEKSDSVLANDDSVSQRSDGSKSTSGCSSMIPQADARRRESGLEKRKAGEPELFSTGNNPTSPGDQPSKRQRLQVSMNSSRTWTRGLGDSFSQQQASAAVNRPSFNSSLFGSPMVDESSLLGSSFHESSFYPGKTTFGGRSSMSFRAKRNRGDLNQSLPSRLSIPVKSFMKAKPKANQAKVAVTSSTAKRILEALDKMPTPLNDAKRIPLSVPRHWTESPSFFARDKPSPVSGPPTEKLNVSSLATISQNRQVSFSPVKRTPQPSTSKQSETRPMPMPSRDETIILGGPGAPSGKMRRDKSYHRGSAAVANRPGLEEEETEILPPNLTTDFTLPVSAMPKFSFSAAQAKTATPSASTPNKPALNFTFSSPIAETVPADKPRSPEKQGGFQFSSPISVDKQPASSSSSDKPKPFATLSGTPVSNNMAAPSGFSFSSPANKSSNMEYTFSSSAAPKAKAKINGKTESPSTNMDSGMQPASELKQGSVMDILGGGSPMTSKSAFGGFSPASELKQGSVMDILGSGKSSGASSSSLMNGPSSSSPLFGKKQNTDKLSGDTAFKQPASTSATVSSSLPPLSSVFSSSGCDKPQAAKQKEEKAPTALKPATSGSQVKNDSLKSAPPLSALVKQSGGWTCDVCLVKNKTDDAKCVACQTSKPGGANSGSSSNATKSSGQNDLLAKFKSPAGQWECEVCLVRNKPDLTTCVACQTPKPLKSFKHPPGDWTCDTCLVSNKQASLKCVACNYQRPGPPRTQAVPSCVKTFSKSQNSGFGALSDTNKTIEVNTSGGGFKIGGDSKADSSASGFTFGSSSTSDTSTSTSGTGGFKFGASSATQDKTTAPSAGGFKLGGSDAITSSSAGGFSFGAPSDSKPQTSTGGFKFGSTSVSSEVSSSSSEQKYGLSQATVSSAAPLAGGFSFGAAVTASTNSVSSDKNKVVSSSTTTSLTSGGVPGGFSFGQTVNKVGDPPQATTSVPGGFTFKPSDSLVNSKSNTAEQTSSIGGTPSIGGFNFSASSNKSDSLSSTNVQTSSVTSNSVGGFSFSASKSTENSLAAGTPATQSTEKKAGFGGFAFGASTSTNTSQPATGFGGFNFAQKPADSVAGQTSSKPTSLKRDRDEDSGATSAKKSFTFGASSGSSSATPFQFGAASSTPATTVANTSASSTPFAFGQSAGSGSTPFTFSAGKSAPVFGAASTTAQSGTTAPAFGGGMSFNFTGQKTEAATTGTTAPVFAFGAQSAQQPSSGTTPAFGGFGSTTSTFGASSTSAFGGSAPSSTPAFGSKPPAFGATNTNTAAAPAFGACVSSYLKDSVTCVVSVAKRSTDEKPCVIKNTSITEDMFEPKMYTCELIKNSKPAKIDSEENVKNLHSFISNSNKLQHVRNGHEAENDPKLNNVETNRIMKTTLDRPVSCDEVNRARSTLSSHSIELRKEKEKKSDLEDDKLKLDDDDRKSNTVKEDAVKLSTIIRQPCVPREYDERELDAQIVNKECRKLALKDASMQTDCCKSTQTSSTEITQPGNELRSGVKEVLDNLTGKCMAFILPMDKETGLSPNNLLKLMNSKEVIPDSCDERKKKESKQTREIPVIRAIMSSLASGPCVYTSPPVSGLVQTVAFPVYSTSIRTSTLSAGSTVTGSNPAKLVSVTWSSGTAMSSTHGSYLPMLPLEMCPSNQASPYAFNSIPAYSQYTGISRVECKSVPSAFPRHLEHSYTQPTLSGNQTCYPQYNILTHPQSVGYNCHRSFLNPCHPKPNLDMFTLNDGIQISQPTGISTSHYSMMNQQPGTSGLAHGIDVSPISFEPKSNINNIVSQRSTMPKFSSRDALLQHKRNNKTASNPFEPTQNLNPIQSNVLTRQPLNAIASTTLQGNHSAVTRLNPVNSLETFKPFCRASSVGVGTTTKNPLFVFGKSSNAGRSLTTNCFNTTVVTTSCVTSVGKTGTKLTSNGFVFQPQNKLNTFGSSSNNLSVAVTKASFSTSISLPTSSVSTSASSALFQFSRPFVSQPGVHKSHVANTPTFNNTIDCNDVIMGECEENKTIKQTAGNTCSNNLFEFSQPIEQGGRTDRFMAQTPQRLQPLWGLSNRPFFTSQGSRFSNRPAFTSQGSSFSNRPIFTAQGSSLSKRPTSSSLGENLTHQTNEMVCAFSSTKFGSQKLQTSDSESSHLPQEAWSKSLIFGGTKDFCSMEGQEEGASREKHEEKGPTNTFPQFVGAQSVSRDVSGKSERCVSTEDMMECKQNSPPKKLKSPLPWLNLTSSVNDNTDTQTAKQDVTALPGIPQPLQNKSVLKLISNASKSVDSVAPTTKPSFSTYSEKGSVSNVFVFSGFQTESSQKSIFKPMISAKSPDLFVFSAKQDNSQKATFSPLPSCSKNISDVFVFKGDADSSPKSSYSLKSSSNKTADCKRSSKKSTVFSGKGTIFLGKGKSACASSSMSSTSSSSLESSTSDSSSSSSDSNHSISRSCSDFDQMEEDAKPRDGNNNNCHSAVEPKQCSTDSPKKEQTLYLHKQGSGGFNNTGTPAAPAQSNAIFQFGAKPQEASQPGGGFNFNPAGLGSQPSFNFGASSTPGSMAFSAQPMATPQTSERKIKKAIRKVRR